jgi:HNH endonuclease
MSQVYIPKALRTKVAAQAKYRCGYCLSQELITGMVMEFDHIIPTSASGKNIEENLWLACTTCNDTKNDRTQARDPLNNELVPLFNPRTQNWNEHFKWSEDKSEIIGQTAIGRATVVALNLNRLNLVKSRVIWAKAGWHPPKD